ncbi:Vitamin B12-binding protein [uncultured archaeon]|nr:Vitamin B12-binding protein [uncultured archaeon]
MIISINSSIKREQSRRTVHTIRPWIIGLMLFLVIALPLTSASGNAASYTLNIFGNANMDEDIDQADVSYVQDIISGNKQSTELADANRDGKIDALDVEQIESIIKGNARNLTIIDAQNRIVTLNLPIEKAVGVNTGAIEIIRDIGVDLNEVFIAASSYALENPKYFSELKGKASNKYGSPDYEALAKLKPDLVILYKKPYKEEAFDKYDAIGAPVICIDCFNQEGLDGSVKILGAIFNKREKANELIDWYHGYIDMVKERTKGLDDSKKPKTLFYFSPDFYYPVIKANTGQSGNSVMVTEAGGINLAENLNATVDTAEVDREWILTQNPDVIIGSVNAATSKSGYSADETKAFGYMHMVLDKLLVDQAIKETNAATHKKIYIVCTDLNRGPMQAAGTVYMAKILHPELFKDINPEDVLKEYFDRWQGIPYQGIYIYPQVD